MLAGVAWLATRPRTSRPFHIASSHRTLTLQRRSASIAIMRSPLLATAAIMLVACSSDPQCAPPGSFVECVCANQQPGRSLCNGDGRLEACSCSADANTVDSASSDIIVATDTTAASDAITDHAATDTPVDTSSENDASVVLMDAAVRPDAPSPADVLADISPDQSGDAGDGGSPCYREPGDVPFCPNARHPSPTDTPRYRITYLQFEEPAALRSQTFQAFMASSFQSGNALWGLAFDLNARSYQLGAVNVTTARFGSLGFGLLDGQFEFYRSNFSGEDPTVYNPISDLVTVTGDRLLSRPNPSRLTLPLSENRSTQSALFPLYNVQMTEVHLSPDRGCIGSATLVSGHYNECRSAWRTVDAELRPYGRIEGDIPVTAARAVQVSTLGTTLCNYIAGTDCALVVDWSTRPEGLRPERMVNGEPAFHVIASFAAISANIQPR